MTPELRDAMRAGAKALRYVAAENVRRAARATVAAGRGMEGAEQEAKLFLADAIEQRAWAGVLEREPVPPALTDEERHHVERMRVVTAERLVSFHEHTARLLAIIDRLEREAS